MDNLAECGIKEYADDSYSVFSGSLAIEDFCHMLKDEAGLGDPDLTWREAAAPFARVSTSHEIDYAKPLNVSAQAPDAHAVKTLEKMFSVFQPIKELEATALDARNRYEVMRRAASMGLSDYISLRSKRDRKNAQAQLKMAERELNDCRYGTDRNVEFRGVEQGGRTQWHRPTTTGADRLLGQDRNIENEDAVDIRGTAGTTAEAHRTVVFLNADERALYGRRWNKIEEQEES
ncbi:putative chromosome segregation ATPase [Bifidobacterium reuteri DSM 23975]|uniref:Putative chromosome segregation ATPase n=1 Tax=Bifidobacterium reuteri DSM 23975 TaxID=1437610 RepID=A0A087CRC4_9BIFI|nr:hypothetical protein [Bifidobacterium reuteri]KFI85824.1 putative chromosome segregation ATPase [Bifidobacterium reuteri DSM 23975]